MNFTIVENPPFEIDYPAFKQDFLNPFMSAKAIKEKYNLSPAKWNEQRKKVLDEEGISRKPHKNQIDRFMLDSATEYIRTVSNGYVIVKWFNCKAKYYGRYADFDTAMMVRNKLVESNWNDDLARYLKLQYGCEREYTKPAFEKAKTLYPVWKEEYINSEAYIKDINKKYGVTPKMYEYLVKMLRDEGVPRRKWVKP